jgi:hypothetical protein
MKYSLQGASSINQEMQWEQQFTAWKYTTKEEFVKYFQSLLHRWKINTERGDMFKLEQVLVTLF